MRTYRKVLAVLGAVLSGIALSPAIAKAAPVPLGHCPSDLICFWTGTNFSGTKMQWAFIGGHPNDDCKTTGLSRQAKSIENNTPYTFSVYSTIGCVTKVGTIYPRTANNNTSSPAWVTYK